MVLMTTKIEEYVKAIGQTHSALLAKGTIPGTTLRSVYEGRDLKTLTIEPGLDLEFSADSLQLQHVFVGLLKTTPSTTAFTGELPPPLKHRMSQTDVRATFGEPMLSKAPRKMPQPMGAVGGIDAYSLDPAAFGRTQVVFQYTAAGEVHTVHFKQL